MKTKFITLLILLNIVFTQAQNLIPFKGQNGKYGFKNTNNKIIVQPKYHELLLKDQVYLNNGMYIPRHMRFSIDSIEKRMKLDSICIYDSKRKNVSLREYLKIRRYIFVSDSLKYGIFDTKTGNETELKYSEFEPTICNSNLFIVSTYNKEVLKYGVIDHTGKEIIPIEYKYISECMFDRNNSANLFLVGTLNNKYGVINIEKKEIIPLKYDESFYFDLVHEGLAMVKLNNKYGFINKIGKAIIPIKYDTIITDSVFALVNIGGAWIDTMCVHEEKTHLSYRNGKWGLLDLSTEKEIIPVKYDFIGENHTINNHDYIKQMIYSGFIPVGIGGIGFSEWEDKYQYGLSSAYWRHRDEYHYLAEYHGEKWGFMDLTGKEVIPTQLEYNHVGIFENDKAKVILNGEDLYIDKNGNEIKE